MNSLLSRHNLITIQRIVGRELQTRVAGTWLGLLHFAITPLFFLLVYAYVFSSVFVTRWAGSTDAFGSFALRLYVGLIAYQFFAEVVTRSSGLILENPSYVKKIVFPLDILTPAAIAFSLVTAALSCAVFVVGHLFFNGLMPLSAIAALLYFPPLIFMVAGLSWLLSAFGVFLRDLNQIVTTLTPTLMFISPIFYPASAVPDHFKAVLKFNPLAFVIEGARAAIFEVQWPNPVEIGLAYLLSFAFAWFGLAFFRRLKGAFADVV